MQLENFTNILELLKTKLPDYLEERGINTSSNFSCLDPAHEDNTASCGLIPPDRTTVHCFGCSKIFDIFDAANILESLPLSGSGFIEETIPYLAEKFNIELRYKELSEDERMKVQVYQAYKIAASYISANPSELAVAEMGRRGWDISSAARRGIGGIKDYDHFISHLTSHNFSLTFLSEVDLSRRLLFSNTHLIFTIFDNKGRPCGFSARNLLFQSGKENESPKYINTKSFLPNSPFLIYEKSKVLYNLNNARNTKGTIYIMEGCADVETAMQAGIQNVVAICGTAFSEKHAIQLSANGKTDITICLDGDEPGIKSTEKIIEMLSLKREFNVYVTKIPDQMDPDEYIRKTGMKGFYLLRRWSAFEWRLNQYDSRIDPQVLRENIIPVIAGTPSPIERERMSEILGEKIGISKESIMGEVSLLLDEEKGKKSREEKRLLEELSVDLKKNPGDWRLHINKTVQVLETLTKSKELDAYSQANYLKDLDLFRSDEEEIDNRSSLSFPDWREFSNAVSGDWRSTLNVIGGQANSGKCLVFNSPILLSTGEQITIQEVVEKKISNGMMMKDHKIVPCEFTDWVDSGELECFKVTTKSGTSTEPSATHPYYTLDGWKQIKDLKPGDKIALARRYNIEGEETVSLEEARLIGYLLGNGSTTGDFGLSNVDEEIIKDNKRVPREIMTGTKQIISSFLGAFYACDGWISIKENDDFQIGLSLCNYELSKEIRHLLLRLEINSTIIFPSETAEKDGKRFKKFTISIDEAREVIKFKEHITIPLREKQEKLNKISLIALERKELTHKLEDPFLISLAEGDIFFDEITEIKSIGPHQCYDLTVPGEHNFICNDTIVHNTAFMSNLAIQLAAQDRDDCFVLFHSIDDTVRQFTTRLICYFGMEKMPALTLNMIKRPNSFPETKRINEARDYGYLKLKKLVGANKIVVKGGENHYATLEYAEELLKYYIKQLPKKKILYFLDNFHRLRDHYGHDERTRFKNLSQRIKDMAKKYDIGIFCTMEYNKQGSMGRPGNNAISESVAMEYDANLIAHVYNDLHSRREYADTYFERIDHTGATYQAPRIEIIFAKNKLNEFKGSLFFDFYTEQSLFKPVLLSEVTKGKELHAARNKNRQSP